MEENLYKWAFISFQPVIQLLKMWISCTEKSNCESRASYLYGIYYSTQLEANQIINHRRVSNYTVVHSTEFFVASEYQQRWRLCNCRIIYTLHFWPWKACFCLYTMREGKWDPSCSRVKWWVFPISLYFSFFFIFFFRKTHDFLKIQKQSIVFHFW